MKEIGLLVLFLLIGFGGYYIVCMEGRFLKNFTWVNFGIWRKKKKEISEENTICYNQEDDPLTDRTETRVKNE